MTTRLLVPIRGADPRRRPPPEAGLDGVTPVVEGGALLVFSGPEAVRRWREIARFVTVPADEVEGLAVRSGATEVVRDIAGPVRTRSQLPRRSDATPPPFGLRGLASPLEGRVVDRLRELSSRHPAIEKAWVVEATVDASVVAAVAFLNEPGHSDPAALVRSLSDDIVPLLANGPYEGVQLVVVADDEVGRAIRAADEPVYPGG